MPNSQVQMTNKQNFAAGDNREYIFNTIGFNPRLTTIDGNSSFPMSNNGYLAGPGGI